MGARQVPTKIPSSLKDDSCMTPPMTASAQIELRKASLRGSIENFTRVLRSAEKEAAEYRAWIKEAKAELLALHEDEAELEAFINEVEGP
jgi:hypothetical protein